MDGSAAPVVFVVGRDRGARGALTGALVRALGVQAVSMAGGDGVVAWARALRPALVLVDARTPRPDAVGLVERLRADPLTAGTVILAVGAPSAVASRGCDAVVADPAPAAVADAVRSWLLPTDRRSARPRRSRPVA
jgi:CheY-like chemotaxis protein